MMLLSGVMSYHTNGMTLYITFGYCKAMDAVHDNLRFSVETISIFKTIKLQLKQSYDKQNLALIFT